MKPIQNLVLPNKKEIGKITLLKPYKKCIKHYEIKTVT